MINAKYRVTLWEYERGWGSRHWSDTDFDTLEEAQDFQRKENAKNDKPYVPDWYVTADNPRLVDADKEPPRN